MVINESVSLNNFGMGMSVLLVLLLMIGVFNVKTILESALVTLMKKETKQSVMESVTSLYSCCCALASANQNREADSFD